MAASPPHRVAAKTLVLNRAPLSLFCLFEQVSCVDRVPLKGCWTRTEPRWRLGTQQLLVGSFKACEWTWEEKQDITEQRFGPSSEHFPRVKTEQKEDFKELKMTFRPEKQQLCFYSNVDELKENKLQKYSRTCFTETWNREEKDLTQLNHSWCV